MAARQPWRIRRRIIAGLRKLHIFPRLLVVFCVLLLSSTLFITLINQRNFAKEIESTTADYLSMLVQNAAYKLAKEAERLEEGMTLFTQNEQLLQAVATNGELASTGQQQSALFEANRAFIEHELLNVGEQVGGIKALIFVSDGIQYRMAPNQNNERGAFFPDLEL